MGLLGSVKQPRRALLVFSKGADFGNVKTRMRPALNDAQCLALNLALLKDTIQTTTEVQCDRFLWLTRESQLPFDPEISIRFQQGPDLGARLQRAFEEMLPHYESVIIIGTDSPTLTSNHIEIAFDMLQTHDIVLGPTEDGGYYLVGLSAPAWEIFENIPWSTSSVLARTQQAARSRRVFLLPVLFDVDQPADLRRLAYELLRMPLERAHFTRTLIAANSECTKLSESEGSWDDE